MASSKQGTTFAKLNKEQKRREKRIEKQARKDARKLAAANGEEAAVDIARQARAAEGDTEE